MNLAAHTVVSRTPLVPEIALRLITEACPLWRASEAEAAAHGFVDPYWAFCWPGGQALARHVLDHPDLVRGRRVLDFGSGCGVEAIAALLSGARSATCADVDPVAADAARLNAELNGVAVETCTRDLIGADIEADVVLAGDVFYDPATAASALRWLRSLDALVLIGDPSRGFLDVSALSLLATYPAGADGDVSGTSLKATSVFTLAP